MEYKYRKKLRLENFNYGEIGIYYLTFCVEQKVNLLSRIIKNEHDEAQVELSNYGFIVNETIKNIEKIYANITINKYVIMPNHVHLLIVLNKQNIANKRSNEQIPKIISSIKRFTNKKIGFKIWQRGYHDHLIRDEKDYQIKYQYIENNPHNWEKDDYYPQI